MQLPSVGLRLAEKEAEGVCDKVLDAGALKADGEEGIDRRNDHRREKVKLRQRENREQKPHADDAHVPQLPEEQRRFGFQVVGVQVQNITYNETILKGVVSLILPSLNLLYGGSSYPRYNQNKHCGFVQIIYSLTVRR